MTQLLSLREQVKKYQGEATGALEILSLILMQLPNNEITIPAESFKSLAEEPPHLAVEILDDNSRRFWLAAPEEEDTG